MSSSVYERHFASENEILTGKSRKAIEQNAWVTAAERREKFGTVVERVPEGCAPAKLEGITVSCAGSMFDLPTSYDDWHCSYPINSLRN